LREDQKCSRKSINDFNGEISPGDFSWVIYNGQLIKHEDLSDQGRRELDKVYPVWNFDLRRALNQATEAPDRENKYVRFKEKILFFYKNYLSKDDFKEIIPIDCSGLTKVDKIKLGQVKSNSNKLIFGNKQLDISPINGMKQYGPFELSTYTKVHFFFIFHKSDLEKAKKIDSYFKGEEDKFGGLYKYTKLYYHTEKNFSIRFENKDNPVPEIEQQVREKKI
jgi:hypothetical protein